MSFKTKSNKYKLLYTSTSSDSDSDIFVKMSLANSTDDLVIVEADLRTTSAMRHKTEVRRILYENVTTVVHILGLQFVIFILYLSFSHEIELFTWHPILLSVGWMCLMTEGILSISSDNCITKYLSHSNKVFLHWLLQSIATISTFVGFSIVFINKNLKNKQHFKTWHGIFGLISVVCLIPTCIIGVSTLYKIDLKRFIKPVLNKTFHIICGTTTFIIGTVTVILSLYSNWFTKKASTSAQVLCFIVVLVTAVWILLRPLKTLRKFI